MELPAGVQTFIVRVTPGPAREIAGSVERVRTGEKRRFTGLDGLGVLLRRMVAEATTHPGSSEPDERRGGGDEGHQDRSSPTPG